MPHRGCSGNTRSGTQTSVWTAPREWGYASLPVPPRSKAGNIWSRPQWWVTNMLYIPASSQPERAQRRPGWLLSQGHTQSPRQGWKGLLWVRRPCRGMLAVNSSRPPPSVPGQVVSPTSPDPGGPQTARQGLWEACVPRTTPCALLPKTAPGPPLAGQMFLEARLDTPHTPGSSAGEAAQPRQAGPESQHHSLEVGEEQLLWLGQDCRPGCGLRPRQLQCRRPGSHRGHKGSRSCSLPQENLFSCIQELGLDGWHRRGLRSAPPGGQVDGLELVTVPGGGSGRAGRAGPVARD